ncbi:MAG: hypothetical protein GWN00_01235 [Aliifodinibius sp.]|nr:hypothetical protein [Fodinibius sp.]NIV09955.1 hypothetical protein [Fodinibius sp.]NIY23485.1 hypothetical protein [Fodinibius sp.]
MLKFKAKQGMGSVTKQDKTGEVQVTEKVGDPVLSEKPLANLGVSLGTTINTGNYNNVKIQVSLHMPAGLDEIDVVFEKALTWVDAKLNEVKSEVIGE